MNKIEKLAHSQFPHIDGKNGELPTNYTINDVSENSRNAFVFGHRIGAIEFAEWVLINAATGNYFKSESIEQLYEIYLKTTEC